jgi:hypothetical protein
MYPFKPVLLPFRSRFPLVGVEVELDTDRAKLRVDPAAR